MKWNLLYWEQKAKSWYYSVFDTLCHGLFHSNLVSSSVNSPRRTVANTFCKGKFIPWDKLAHLQFLLYWFWNRNCWIKMLRLKGKTHTHIITWKHSYCTQLCEFYIFLQSHLWLEPDTRPWESLDEDRLSSFCAVDTRRESLSCLCVYVCVCIMLYYRRLLFSCNGTLQAISTLNKFPLRTTWSNQLSPFLGSSRTQDLKYLCSDALPESLSFKWTNLHSLLGTELHNGLDFQRDNNLFFTFHEQTIATGPR